MANRSRIYQTVSQKDIEQIVKSAIGKGTSIYSSKKLLGGLFNTTYLIETSNPAKKIVLRIAPIRQELLVDFEKAMMPVEPIMYKLFKQNGIPAPNVVIFDDSKSIIPRDYIITEFIDSIPLSDPSFPNEHRDKIHYDLGVYTAKIHSIKSDTFGWPNPDNTIRGSKRWPDVVKLLSCELIEKSLEYNVFEEKIIYTVRDFFEKNIEEFDINEKPSLVHNDLWDPNVLVNEIDGVWEIVGIIDADRAMFADPEFEFVLWPEEPHFMRGYGKKLDMSNEARLRRWGYALINLFMCAYVMKVQYDDTEWYENTVARTMEVLDQMRAEGFMA